MTRRAEGARFLYRFFNGPEVPTIGALAAGT